MLAVILTFYSTSFDFPGESSREYFKHFCQRFYQQTMIDSFTILLSSEDTFPAKLCQATVFNTTVFKRISTSPQKSISHNRLPGFIYRLSRTAIPPKKINSNPIPSTSLNQNDHKNSNYISRSYSVFIYLLVVFFFLSRIKTKNYKVLLSFLSHFLAEIKPMETHKNVVIYLVCVLVFCISHSILC